MKKKEETTPFAGWLKATRQLLNMFYKEDYEPGRLLTDLAIITRSLHVHSALHLQSTV